MPRASVAPAIAVSGVLLSAVVFDLTAGPLDPPSGPVASTYKTLAEVEPRIAISAMNTPGDADSVYRITGSGSYYLVADVAAPSGRSAIEVDLNVAPDVTIDLNGFTLRGATGSLRGIVSSGFGHIEVANGSITGFGQDGMELDCRTYRVERVTFSDCLRGLNAGGYGKVSDCTFWEIVGDALRSASIACVAQCRFWDCGTGISVPNSSVVTECQVVSSSNAGIIVGSNSVVRDCVSVSNGDEGFATGDNVTLSQCVAEFNQIGFLAGDGSVLESCTSDGNTAEGFWTADSCIFRTCTATGNQLQGFRAGWTASFENCTSSGSVGSGFYAGQRSTFVNCRATLGNGAGFEAGPISVFTDCVASENSGGSGFLTLENATFTGCRASTNANRGFQTTSRTSFTACQATNNGSIGFDMADQSTLSGCLAANNGAGISGTDSVTVSGCTASSNVGYGISVNNGCRIVDNLTRNNGFDGILVNFSCDITGNNCNGDGAAAGNHGAIRVAGQANRIDGNNVSYSDRGLYLTSGGNVVVRNTVKGCTVNFDIVGGNDVGPIGSASTSTSPWANIQF